MTAFEYGSGLISIVVGLGAARVLGGIALFLGLETRRPSDWIVAGWCSVLFVNLIFWWISNWFLLSHRPEIPTSELIFFTLSTAMLYLAAHLLAPAGALPVSEHGESGFQLPRPPFFGCLIAHFGTMFVYQFVVTQSDAEIPAGGNAVLAGALLCTLMLVAAIGTRVETVRAHSYVIGAWVVTLVGLGSMTQAIGA